MTLPKFADSVEEVTLVKFLVEPGEYVFEDDDIIEIESQKGNTMIKSSLSGMVSGYLVELDSDLNIGDEYCEIDVDAPKPDKKPVSSATTSTPAPTPVTEKKETPQQAPKKETPKQESKPSISEVIMPASGKQKFILFLIFKFVKNLCKRCQDFVRQ
jgi:2-oxoisovalerate dehydrogenase E2 component (dihydrolipoyl transacylase)